MRIIEVTVWNDALKMDRRTFRDQIRAKLMAIYNTVVADPELIDAILRAAGDGDARRVSSDNMFACRYKCGLTLEALEEIENSPDVRFPPLYNEWIHEIHNALMEEYDKRKAV